MKAVTLGCNIIFIGFTLFIMVTEGSPSGVFFIILTIFLLLIPMLSTLVIAKSRIRADLQPRREMTGNHEHSFELNSAGTKAEISCTVLNLVMLGTSLGILISQYPHPEETGFYLYVGLLLLTPVLNLLNFTNCLAKKSCLRNLKM